MQRSAVLLISSNRLFPLVVGGCQGVVQLPTAGGRAPNLLAGCGAGSLLLLGVVAIHLSVRGLQVPEPTKTEELSLNNSGWVTDLSNSLPPV